MLLNKEQVQLFLPHRDPFLFIDSVESIIIDEKEIGIDLVITAKELQGAQITAHYKTDKDHAIFAGHFPGNPILPGVVQVEMMAQAATFSILALIEKPFEVDLNVALLSVANAKFRAPVTPGMDLVIKATCIKNRAHFMSYDCEILSGGKIISQASVMASVTF